MPPEPDILQLLNFLQTQYPQYFNIITLEPQILDIFKQVYMDPAAWPPERVQAAIMDTTWFKTHTDAERNWTILATVDPATARKRVDDVNILIRQIAGQIGIPPNMIDPLMVLQAAQDGWDEGRIRLELVARLNGKSPLGPGGITDQADQFRALAAQYGVNLNEGDLLWWAENTIGGSVTAEGFRSFLLSTAKNLYPALSSILDAGQTVAGFAAPYFSLAARELGVAPTVMQANNPLWMDLVLGSDKNGNQGVLSQNEALAKIRSDPRYGYDAGLPARTEASQFATQLLTKFGAMG